MDVLFTSWFVSIASIAHSVPIDVFYIVSPSNDSEEFYLELNRIGPHEVQALREEFVCAAILKSPFFSTDSDLEVVYPIPKGNSHAQLVLSQNGWDMLRRPYDLVNVSVLQDVRQEAVFPCLARQKGKNELSLYLISHEYDFNRWIKRDKARGECPPAGGRFVFEYNESKKMASLLAIAEEPTTRLGDDGYYMYDNEHFAGVSSEIFTRISERSQEICEFSTGRKVRVCAIGLNAIEFRDEVTFLPLEDRIEPQCEKRELIYTRFGLHDFSGWVIGCKADDLNTRETTTYYMSVGYEPYELLIYHPEKESNVSHLRHHYLSYIGEDHVNCTPLDYYIDYMPTGL